MLAVIRSHKQAAVRRAMAWLARLSGVPSCRVTSFACWRTACALAASILLLALFVSRVRPTIDARVWWVGQERSGLPQTAHVKIAAWREFGRRCQAYLGPSAVPVLLAGPASERALASRYFLLPYPTAEPTTSWSDFLEDVSPLVAEWSSSSGTQYALFPPLAPEGEARVIDALQAQLGPRLEVTSVAGGAILTYQAADR